MLSVGTPLGPYTILAPLGEGGRGEVYQAEDIRLGRQVAVKLLPEVFTKDAEWMARFQREAQVLVSIKLHDDGESRGERPQQRIRNLFAPSMGV